MKVESIHGITRSYRAERVVITGLGAITPSGQNAEALWDSVREGRSAITELEGPEYADLAVRIGGQVRGFDAAGAVGAQLARRISPVQQWAIAAADEALEQAGIVRPSGSQEDGASGEGPGGGVEAVAQFDPQRVAVIAATGSGPIDAMQAATRAFDARGPRAVPLTLSMHGAPDSAAALLSQRYGFQGPAQGVSATCASGAIGLGEALRRIRHGYADAVLVVGMEDCLNAVNLSSNANMRALAAGYEQQPAAASRPFDRARAGFVMSQGAAAILVESAGSARRRGARVLAELVGFGASSDAHHPTSPHPEGRGAAQAIAACLADAELTPADIDHINAHGTGTPAGDAAELRAFETALGERARQIPISATKSSTGHLLGAAGVVEAIITVLALRDGVLPPTLNLEQPEEDGWNFIAGQARKLVGEGAGAGAGMAEITAGGAAAAGNATAVATATSTLTAGAVHDRLPTALSTSFGFGGHNGAVILRAWGDDLGAATVEVTEQPASAHKPAPQLLQAPSGVHPRVPSSIDEESPA